jgi:L-2-hydroxyglutarate oxidase LhgO
MLYALAPEAGVFVKRTGKLIVAAESSELPALAELCRRAEEAGAEGLEALDGAGARAKVPGLRAAGALWSPETGIVDSEELMLHFRRRAEEQGAFLLFSSPLTAAERSGASYELTFGPSGEKVRARFVVNAGGLHADKVAALPGLDAEAAGYRLRWCKGSYFRSRRDLGIAHLVYPLPERHGLGVHLTLDRRGGARFGPDIEFVETLDYEVDEAKRERFAEAARRYLPGIGPDDLVPDTSGIRPKLAAPDSGSADFIINEESARGLPGWVNLVGIESPGLTASPAIAEHVASLLGL